MARLGHSVIGVDIDLSKIEAYTSGRMPIHEEGLEEALKSSIDNQSLRFASDVSEASASSEVFFVCVETPQSPSGVSNLERVFTACSTIALLASPGAIIVLKSTVPVGTAKKIRDRLSRKDLQIVSNPEFLREGSALRDFDSPDRVVIGSDSEDASKFVAHLYSGTSTQVLLTSNESAELIKYASNAYLASRLSFVNEITGFCEKTGADVNDVLYGMGLDSRIGGRFLTPGPGWGGSCFPKDSAALVESGVAVGAQFATVQSAIESNNLTFDRVASEIINLANDTQPRDAVVAVLGLAFKAGTDDTRDSPALEITRRLVAKGAVIRAYDPQANAPQKESIQQFESVMEAVEGADVVAVLTEWPEFNNLDPKIIQSAMRGSALYDARRVVNKDLWAQHFTTVKILGDKNE